MKVPPNKPQSIACDSVSCLHNKDMGCLRSYVTILSGACSNFKIKIKG